MSQLLLGPPPPPEYCFLWADKWWPWADPWWLCMQKAEWSGWAQAIGAILAILAAVGVAYLQHKQNLEQQKRSAAAELARIVSGPLAVAERTLWQMKQFYSDLRKVDAAASWRGAPIGMDAELRRLMATFESLQLTSLPTYELVHAAQKIGENFRLARSLLSEMGLQKDASGHVSQSNAEECVSAISAAGDEIETFLTAWRKARAEELGFRSSGRVTRVHQIGGSAPDNG